LAVATLWPDHYCAHDKCCRQPGNQAGFPAWQDKQQAMASSKKTLRQVLWLMAMSWPLAQQAQPCTATLCGTVTADETGMPIPYAEVIVEELNLGVITDEEGKFHFHQLCDGVYNLVCRHIGCAHVARSVTVVGNTTVDFTLHHEAIPLQAITVTERATAPASMRAGAQLSGSRLDGVRGQAFGAALRQLPGVSVLQTGNNIVKPVVRGLHSSRLLILNGGVRLESQQWGTDHAPEIDPYAAEEIQVEYGAGSLRYGGDAIAGVMLVRPPALPTSGGWEGSWQSSVHGNGGIVSGGGHLAGKLSGPLPLAARIQGSFRRGGNIRTPDYWLENTGVREGSYAATVGMQRRKWQAELHFSQFLSDIGVFRGAHIGNLTDLQDALRRGRPLQDGDFSYGLSRPMQRVAHYLLKAAGSIETGEHSWLRLQYARQFNRRQEFDAHRRFGARPAGFSQPDMLFELTTHNLEAVWEHTQRYFLTGSTGVQATWQANTTDRGGLIPDHRSGAWGVFWVERWRKYPFPVEAELGLRYDSRSMDIARRGDTEIGRRLQFHNFSANTGLAYHVSDWWKIRLHAGTAWRPPAINELYSEGVHHGTASYETGNPGLSAEQSLSFGLVTDFRLGERISGNLSLYQNQLRNFIYLRPQEAPILTIRGAFPAFSYEQADVRMRGMEWKTVWQVYPPLSIATAGALVRAWNRDLRDWLVFMPADRIQQDVRWSPARRSPGHTTEPYVQVSVETVFRQRRVPAAQDYADPPGGYTLLHLEAGASASWRSKPLEAGIRIRNLTNSSYRDYLNRLRYFSDEAGRDLSVWCRIRFRREANE
jgi:iron complex outermembrane receptor protein